jgi:hypothetical protein
LYSDAVKDGGSNYYKTVINRDSKYVFINEAALAAEFSGSAHAAPGNAASAGKKFNAAALSSSLAIDYSLVKGSDGSSAGDALKTSNVTAALGEFENPEAIDINLLFAEGFNGDTAIHNKVIDIAGNNS